LRIANEAKIKDALIAVAISAMFCGGLYYAIQPTGITCAEWEAEIMADPTAEMREADSLKNEIEMLKIKLWAYENRKVALK